MKLRDVHPLCADILDGKYDSDDHMATLHVMQAIEQAAKARWRDVDHAMLADSPYAEKVRFRGGKLAGRTATVLRRNPKTVTVRMDDDGTEWRVGHATVNAAEQVAQDRGHRLQ